MDLTTAFSALVGAGFASSVVGVILAAILKRWLDGTLTQLEHTLAVERQELAERRALERRRREASAAMAEILSEWKRTAYLGQATREDIWRLQTTYWKHVLWLDERLVSLLAPVLAWRHGPPTTDDTDKLLIAARTILLGLEKPDLTPDQLINWTFKPEQTSPV